MSRIKPRSCLLVSALLMNSIHSVCCSSAHGENSNIRGGVPLTESGSPNHNSNGVKSRIHPIKRIYSPENAAVRAAVHRIETENGYRETGVRANPSFEVPYDNHPFDPKRRRHLQSTSESQVSANENLMKPMRIKWYTDALDNMAGGDNDAKIHFIKTQILPRTSQFWSETLSVFPVSGNLKIQFDDTYPKGFCGDSEFTAIPESHWTKGVSDTDLLLYVSGTPSPNFCGPTTLAVAVACNWDQYDRPIAGAINFCLDQIKLDSEGNASPWVIDDNVDVAIHEAGHVLGMSSNSYRYFWDAETGSPRTARPIKYKTVKCVTGETKTTQVPDENTLKFIQNDNGDVSAWIVTQKVRAVARNQFNCQDLEGAQLENQPTGSSCTGDHFDERLFYPESLSGVISPSTNIVSPLSLALLEDSGWYAANYTKTSVSPWGHGVGCDFVRKPCLQKNEDGETTVPDFGRGFFCTKASQRGCSPTHNYKMACFFRDYSVSSTQNKPPPQYQYFSNPTFGGLKTADYCPVFGDNYKSSVHQLDCREESNGDGVDWQGLGETFGEDSSCFESSRGEGICYKSKCVNSEFKLKVQMQGKWFTCDYDFQEIDIPTTVSSVLGRKIICPRLSSVCPDMFCPVNCAGRGTCVFDSTVDGIVRPKCQCFDENDTSPGCTSSLVLDGKYIEDGKGLKDINVKGFFDDLVAVFVDDPPTWNTASWCWASAIFALFILLVLCICSVFWPKRRRHNASGGRYSKTGSRNDRRSRSRGRKHSSSSDYY